MMYTEPHASEVRPPAAFCADADELARVLRNASLFCSRDNRAPFILRHVRFEQPEPGPVTIESSDGYTTYSEWIPTQGDSTDGCDIYVRASAVDAIVKLAATNGPRSAVEVGVEAAGIVWFSGDGWTLKADTFPGPWERPKVSQPKADATVRLDTEFLATLARVVGPEYTFGRERYQVDRSPRFDFDAASGFMSISVGETISIEVAPGAGETPHPW